MGDEWMRDKGVIDKDVVMKQVGRQYTTRAVRLND
jgi:hypothetical protein